MSSRIDFTSGSVPRAHPLCPSCHVCSFSPSHVRHRRSSYRRSVRFQHGVSAVATGSQIMQTVTNLISSLATGTTVLLGQKIGQKKPSEGGKIAGASLILFALIGIAFSLLLTLGAAPLSRAMNAPEAAFLKTVHYLSICGGGASS